MLPAEMRLPVALAWAAVATLVGIPAATRVARALGQADPHCVVIDEMAGQMIAFCGTASFAGGMSWKSLLAGFILFRCFDILKPPPLRRLERLPEGTGIVVDDLGAGVYALIVAQILLRLGFIT